MLGCGRLHDHAHRTPERDIKAHTRLAGAALRFPGYSQIHRRPADDGLGRGADAPRCQEAAGRGRLEHLHDHRHGHAFDNPVTLSGHAATGEQGWFGWPSDETQEKLRDKWAKAETPEQRKAIAPRMQKNAWDFVPHVYLGHLFRVSAWRKSVTGVIGMPDLVPFWNIEKAA
jgi:ABC-type transport system substrate-binding protein